MEVDVRRAVWLLGMIVGGGVSWGQAPVLQRLAEQSAAYQKTLPDFTCEEKAVSALKHKSKVVMRVEFGATVRVVRDGEGKLGENSLLTEYMGKPVVGAGVYPMAGYVQGGFARGAPGIFAAEKQGCFRYAEKPGRIEFEAVAFGGVCDEPPGTRGFVLLDAAGEVTHEETRRDAEAARRVGMTSFTAIDYEAVGLGDESYRLPVRLYAEMKNGVMMRTFEAGYSGCNRFHATVTVRPEEPE